MQDRAVEPDRTGNIRVSMKRIEITAETINKGLARQGIDITYMIRRPIRQHCGCRTRLVFTAEPPITATESRHRHARQFFTAVRVDNITALVNDGSLALALVGDEVDLAAADNPAMCRQRLVDVEPLFSVQHFLPVYAGLGIAQPEAGIPQNDRHRGNCLEPVLIDIGQLLFVGRILTEPKAECIQDGIPLGQRLFDFLKVPVRQCIEIQWHLLSSLSCRQSVFCDPSIAVTWLDSTPPLPCASARSISFD